MDKSENPQKGSDALPPGAVLPAATCSPLGEALKTLGAMRNLLVDKRQELLDNPSWRRYDEYWKLFSDEIAAVDKRFDTLSATAAENLECSHGANHENQ